MPAIKGGPMRLLDFFASVYVLERDLLPESERQLKMSLMMFVECFGDVELDQLSHTMLNEWPSRTTRDWSPKTLRRRILDVLAVWTYAYRVGVTDNQPNRLRIKPVKVPMRIPESWTLDELQRMLQVCDSYRSFLPNGVRRGSLLKAVICVGFYSALRASDLFALMRKDLSAAGSSIPQGKKHGEEVLVIVPAWVIDMIDAAYPDDVELVFAWPYRREYFYAEWMRMLSDAGLPTGKQHGLQKLRRTAVSYGEAVERGFGSLLAGHATQRTTYRHYVDPRIVRLASKRMLPDIRGA